MKGTFEEVLVDGTPDVFLDDHAGLVEVLGVKLRPWRQSNPGIVPRGMYTHCEGVSH